MHTARIVGGLTGVLAVPLIGGATNASADTRATPLGPEGGSVVWLNAYPKLLIAGVDNWSDGNLKRSSLGIWASVDGGDSWRRATARQRLSLRLPPWDGRVSDPNNTRIRYRFTTNRFAETGRIDISRDGGKTWQIRSRAVADVGYATLLALPTRPTTLLLGIGEGRPDVLNPTSSRGVRRSTDGGVTWHKTAGIVGKVRLMRVDPTRARTVYATTETSKDHHALFKSTDGGATWHATGRGLPFASTRHATPEDLLVGGTRGARLLFATSVGIYRSADAGATWKRVRPEFTIRLVPQPSRPLVVYAGTPVGMLRSDDGGRTWRDRNVGLRATYPAALAVAGNPARIYVTGFLGRSTVASSADGGATWTLRKPLTTVGFPPFHVVVDRTAPNAVIVEAGLGLKRSTDFGATWRASSPRLVVGPVADQVTRDIYAIEFIDRGKRILRSSDFGVTWTPGGLVDTDEDVVAASGHLYYAKYEQKRLWRSVDGGATWSRTAPLPGDLVMSLAVAPSDPMTIYAEWADFDDPTLDEPPSGIARSRDGGVTWQAMRRSSMGLDSLLVDRRDPNRLYAGIRDSGLWTSGDGGATWIKLSKVPTYPSTIVQSADEPQSLYVGAVDAGVWKIALPW